MHTLCDSPHAEAHRPQSQSGVDWCARDLMAIDKLINQFTFSGLVSVPGRRGVCVQRDGRAHL